MNRRAWLAIGLGAAAFGAAWIRARRRARSFEDRDVLAATPPGQRIEIEGATLHYIERGRGPGIVLIHGLGASTYTWRYNIDGLARDFHVVAVDLLGFGYSQRVADADYSLTGHARRVAALMERLGVDSAVVVGHSLGGLLALRLATAFPDRVRGLVLVDPASPREARALAATRYLSALSPFFYAFAYQNRAMRRRSLSMLYRDAGTVPDDVVEHYLAMARFKGHQEGLARLARALPRDPPLDVRSVSVPVLIVWGERDRLVPASRARWLLDRLPAAHLVRVADAGHMAPEERPEQFNRIIEEFAAGAPSPAR